MTLTSGKAAEGDSNNVLKNVLKKTNKNLSICLSYWINTMYAHAQTNILYQNTNKNYSEIIYTGQ